LQCQAVECPYSSLRLIAKLEGGGRNQDSSGRVRPTLESARGVWGVCLNPGVVSEAYLPGKGREGRNLPQFKGVKFHLKVDEADNLRKRGTLDGVELSIVSAGGWCVYTKRGSWKETLRDLGWGEGSPGDKRCGNWLTRGWITHPEEGGGGRACGLKK